MMDFTQYVLIGAVIAGLVELITRVRARDWWVVVTILSAGLVGAIFGLAGYYPELDAVEGLAAGLGASGAITALGAVRSTPKPSAPVQS
jgi:uncharacterized membrane protein HdeD (DUF308 family)